MAYLAVKKFCHLGKSIKMTSKLKNRFKKCVIGTGNLFSHYHLIFIAVRWVADNQPESKIVGFPYSSKQMFWISFSQVWCFRYRDETLKSQILTGSHSPGRFRVIGSLSNNRDFAKDFNCPIGSKMNPEKKCTVW